METLTWKLLHQHVGFWAWFIPDAGRIEPGGEFSWPRSISSAGLLVLRYISHSEQSIKYVLLTRN